MTSAPTTELDDDGTIWALVDEQFVPPRGGRAFAYRLSYAPPGLPRETRTLVIDELGPADDRLARKQAGGTATELISNPSAEAMCVIWWLGGRQDGKRETYRELEPLFSHSHLRTGEGEMWVGFDMPTGGIVDELEVDDDVDPTQGAST